IAPSLNLTPGTISCGDGFSAVLIEHDLPDAGSMPVYFCGTNVLDGGVVGARVMGADAPKRCAKRCLNTAICPLGPTFAVDVKQLNGRGLPNIRTWSQSGTNDAGVPIRS